MFTFQKAGTEAQARQDSQDTYPEQIETSQTLLFPSRYRVRNLHVLIAIIVGVDVCICSEHKQPPPYHKPFRTFRNLYFIAAFMVRVIFCFCFERLPQLPRQKRIAILPRVVTFSRNGGSFLRDDVQVVMKTTPHSIHHNARRCVALRETETTVKALPSIPGPFVRPLMAVALQNSVSDTSKEALSSPFRLTY